MPFIFVPLSQFCFFFYLAHPCVHLLSPVGQESASWHCSCGTLGVGLKRPAVSAAFLLMDSPVSGCLVTCVKLCINDKVPMLRYPVCDLSLVIIHRQPNLIIWHYHIFIPAMAIYFRFK